MTDGRLSVNVVADELGVSSETIRRDLGVLERQGLAQRVHGGAVAARAVSLLEAGLAQRTSQRPAEKALMARAALQFLPPSGGSVAFDAGTSIERLIESIPADYQLTALTHSIPIATKLMAHEDIDLHVIGGRVRGITAAAVGAATIAGFAGTNVDVSFVGTNGASPEHGFSTHDSEEASVKQALIRSGRLVVAVFDSTKFQMHQVFSFASYEDIDVVVTDSDAHPDDIAPLKDAGVEVVLA